jgi:hypothetical protein
MAVPRTILVNIAAVKDGDFPYESVVEVIHPFKESLQGTLRGNLLVGILIIH